MKEIKSDLSNFNDDELWSNEVYDYVDWVKEGRPVKGDKKSKRKQGL